MVDGWLWLLLALALGNLLGLVWLVRKQTAQAQSQLALQELQQLRAAVQAVLLHR